MIKTITFKGNPLTLVGRVLKEGVIAPDFNLTSQDLKVVTLADFKGRFKIITSFPSIDTPVCDLQVKEFNKRATGISSEVVIVGVSKDLPFAQKRFCSQNEIKNITVVSDYKTGSFGINYGFLIKELNLLARTIIIVDKENIVRYIQIVGEVSIPPDYEEALKRLEEVVKFPASGEKNELPAHCKPCEGGTLPLPKEKIERLLAKYRGWELVEDKKLLKEFKFKDFVEAKYFVDLVAVIAEEQGHHPTITVIYNKVRVTLTTHAAGGLTDNDFIMAKIIDELG
ncbi:MAG: thiol peroxidase [Candidatus Omnitrophica bacterium]|nr:thiol peroxidase [Candidatus Omnitrophota bacterium]